MVATMTEWQLAARETPTEVYKVGQNATRLLMSVGDLLIALAADPAGGGRDRRPGRRAPAEIDFYTGKTAVARFFTTTVLPELAARRRVLEQTDNALMGVPTTAF